MKKTKPPMRTRANLGEGVTVRMPDPVLRWLQRRALKRYVSMSDEIRQAVIEYRERCDSQAAERGKAT